MANPSPAASPSTAYSNLVISSHPISLKLNKENYLLWKQQVLPAIRGHNMQQHIASDSQLPPKFMSQEDEVRGILNPEFLVWQQKDQLLLTWLLSSISEPMLVHFFSCNQSKQLWDEIHHFFYSRAGARAHQYLSELRDIKKGSRTVSEYLLDIKSLVAALAFAKRPITTEEHIKIILNGLPREYNNFVLLVTTADNQFSGLTIPKLESLLLILEAWFDERHKDNANDAFSGNVALNQSFRQPRSFNPSMNPPDLHAAGFACSGGYQAPVAPAHGGRIGNSGPQDCSGGQFGGSRVVICQVCGRHGHEAAACDRGYDLIFQPSRTYQQFGLQHPGGYMAPLPLSQRQFLSEVHPTAYPSSYAYPQYY
ncbi:uncharacterized protein [Arachis hypogaea]|uniref:uncharacterized protein n=1 Tax=Arachis hypogaea TaxID=3818 RepID=UPI003B228355